MRTTFEIRKPRNTKEFNGGKTQEDDRKRKKKKISRLTKLPKNGQQLE